MKFLLFFLLSLPSFGQCTCSTPTGNTIVFFGNSITVGVGASTPSLRFSSLLADQYGMTEINMGVSGTKASQLNKSLIPVYNPSIHRWLFFEYGTNDLAQGDSPDLFLANSSDNANYAISVRGWPPSKIVMLSIPGSFTHTCPTFDLYTLALEFKSRLQSLCNSLGMQFIDVSTPFYSTTPSWTADNVHPNDTGYLLGMALPIESVIR